MSDLRYRTARRDWLSSGSRDAWISYLKESRRIGQPVFNPSSIAQILQGNVVYEPTSDGFVATVTKAVNPLIEREFKYSVGYEEWDSESAPIWNWWSGKLVVLWSNYFGPECPGVYIEVQDCGFLGPNASTSPPYVHEPPSPFGSLLGDTCEHIGEEFIYERDCITDQESLSKALVDPHYWNT